MDATSPRDEPWQRLPWSLPIALLASSVGVYGFLWLLTGHGDIPPPPPPPIEMQLVEMPPPAEPIAAPSNVEPAPPEPPPPEPPPPVPEPAPKPPPKPRPVVRVAPTAPKPVAPPAETPPPSPSAASAPLPVPVSPEPKPGGNSMGARAIYQPLPEIPEALRRRNIELVAVARFHVAANGSAQVDLIEPTPEPTLNRALLETLAKWRFFPAIAQGKPVASDIDIRVPISVH